MQQEKPVIHFAPKQIEFIANGFRKYNLAHGSVRSGKTVCTLFRFIQEVMVCPGSSIFIIGYSLSTIYQNVIALLFDVEELNFYKPYCTWSPGSHTLLFLDKKIKCLGAGDEGALGTVQGLTIDLCYCDEMTLYPESVIDMIDSRLSREHSKLYASMNPKQPDHKVKKWIDRAEAGDPDYYSLHFTLHDNIFLPDGYVENLRKNSSGMFYKRNFLGIWCMAEGAIYDFFDKTLHVRDRPPCAAEYYIAGLDYGTAGTTACVLIGVNTGRATQTGKRMWVEREFYWAVANTSRQKTDAEFVVDIKNFLEPYGVKALYIDPSAASLRLALQRAKLPCIDADNEVLDGIRKTASFIQQGTLSICSACTNLIKEMEAYVWDPQKAKKGEDAPLKVFDHALDALRYVIQTHNVPSYVAPKMATNDFRNYGQIRMG